MSALVIFVIAMLAGLAVALCFGPEFAERNRQEREK